MNRPAHGLLHRQRTCAKITPVLKRPTRPLPRQFNRPLTDKTRSFVERRHKRTSSHKRERWRRWLHRIRAVILKRLGDARRWLKVLLIGFTVLVACLFLFSPILHVREIRVIRTEGRVDLPTVLEALAPLYGRHLLFLSTRDVTSLVHDVVPDATTVTVSKSYPSELSVRISLAPLIARVQIVAPREVAVPLGSGSTLPRAGSGASAAIPEQLYLTQNGLLVAAPPPSNHEALPTIRVIDWSVRPIPGITLITPTFFDQMTRAEHALTLEFGQQIHLRTVYLRAREFHLDTATVSFWFDTRSPLQAQLERLRTFLKTVKLTDVKSYLDLRLTGRVVYK